MDSTKGSYAQSENDEFTGPYHDNLRPVFHVMPSRGWLGDPCGPFFYRGVYHLFYQHVRESCQWYWGVCWDHVTSTDLAHWDRQPPALTPTTSWYDADGCFTGSVEMDPETGTPVMFYTGVRLKTNPHCGQSPPKEYDHGLRFVEDQLMAVPEDPDDPYLRKWKKLPTPFISHPPKDAPLSAWRDPSFIQQGDGKGKEWVVLLSSGVRAKGGCVLMYRSQSLMEGWYLAGVMASSSDKELLGTDWECPLLIKLRPLPKTPHPICFAPSQPAGYPETIPSPRELGGDSHHPVDENHSWLFSISPDAASNPIYYYLGHYDQNHLKYDLAEAQGPLQLDLAKTLYAPSAFQDPQGRHIVWSWMQEHRQDVPPSPCQCDLYEYAGCLAIPRVLYQSGRRLLQMPLPEVALLRTATSWTTQGLQLTPQHTVPVQNIGGLHLDLELSYDFGTATHVGLIFKSWKVDGEGSAVVVIHAKPLALHVVFVNCPSSHDPWRRPGPTPMVQVSKEGTPHRDAVPSHKRSAGPAQLQVPKTLQGTQHVLEGTDHIVSDMTRLQGLLQALDEGRSEVRVVGGALEPQQDTHHLDLRVFLDATCLEIFTGTGEVLSTRIYRGHPPPGCQGESGVCLFAVGGEATLTHVAAYEMGAAWRNEANPQAVEAVDNSRDTGEGPSPDVRAAAAQSAQVGTDCSGHKQTPHSNSIAMLQSSQEQALLGHPDGQQDTARSGSGSDLNVQYPELRHHQDDLGTRRFVIASQGSDRFNLPENVMREVLGIHQEEDTSHTNDSYDEEVDAEWRQSFCNKLPSEDMREYWWREADVVLMSKRRGEEYFPGMYLKYLQGHEAIKVCHESR